MATEQEFQGGDGSVVDSPIADTEAFICEVVSLVADTTGADPLELPPLFDAIDPEAVQRVVQSGAAGSTKVRFEYAGCEVVVTGDGGLYVLDGPAQNG